MNGLDASARTGYTSIASIYIATRERSDGGINGAAAAGGGAHRAGLVGGLRAQLATRTVPHPDGARGAMAAGPAGRPAPPRALLVRSQALGPVDLGEA